jgi:exosome complex component RRP46
MKATATATLAAVLPQDGEKNRIVMDPSTENIEGASSVHALAFTSHDDLLLAESEGDFTMDEWNEICELARKICCQSSGKSGAEMVLDDEDVPGPDMRRFLRSTVEAKTSADLHWR